MDSAWVDRGAMHGTDAGDVVSVCGLREVLRRVCAGSAVHGARAVVYGGRHR